MARRIVGPLLVGAALLGCQMATRPPGAPTAVAGPAGTVPPPGQAIELTEILSGYQRPVFVGAPPGAVDVLYIVEQHGVISTASRSGGSWTRGETIADLSDLVLGAEQETCWEAEFNNERGLLGLAFPADHAATRVAYVTYTVDAPCDSLSRGAMVIAEIDFAETHPITSARVLVSVDKPTDKEGRPRPNHNGGGLEFGPDGLLYVALGEGGNGGGRLAQSLTSLWGKLIRIDPRDPDGEGSQRYGIPSDNPYVGQSGARSEIWAAGLRNPWRWSFDRASGDLWIGDVGQFRYESVDVVPADESGRNAGRALDFGWSRCEGAHVHDGTHQGDPEPAACDIGVLPVYEYDHADGRCSVLGGYVYRGESADAWQGSYFFSDYCDGVIRALTPAGLVTGPVVDRPLTFGLTPTGELVIAGQAGTVHAISLPPART